MDNTMWALIWEKVENDFDKFDFSDKPMQKLLYYRTKHIQMATQIITNCIELSNYVSVEDINDLVHGLNHLFFNGAAAGQALEWSKEKKNES